MGILSETVLAVADPVPKKSPRIDRAEEGMEIWEIGPEPTASLAGSSAERIFLGTLTGRPTAPDPEVARQVIGLVRELAHTVPVLHDVSDGGLAVAIAEICIASEVGATIELGEPSLLFSEDPHRVVAVFEHGAVAPPGDIARFIGTVGGVALTFGDATIDIATATDAYRGAIPRRMT